MNNIFKLGFYTSIITAVATVGTFVIAYLTPPLAGPLCAGSCFAYPFSDIASRFPRDYYWMFPAILIPILYVVLITCIHYSTSEKKKIYSHIGLLFAAMSSVIFITDYFIQISVMQPSLLNGEADGVAILSQFNSHGLFIALEELGYLLMCIASLFMSFVFSGNKLAKSIRWTFLLTFILTIVALVIMIFQYGVYREYRFEIAAISINWLSLTTSSILLAIYFKRSINNLLNTISPQTAS